MIDFERFIASIIHEHRRQWGMEEDEDDGIIYECDLHAALREQGLKYESGKIVGAEPEPFEINEKPSDDEMTEFEKELLRRIHYGPVTPAMFKQDASIILKYCRKQVADEIDVDAMVNAVKDLVKDFPRGVFANLTVCQAYKMGIDDTLNKIKKG